MFFRLKSSPEKLRQSLLTQVKDSPFKQFLESQLPDKKQTISDTEFLALDFETTGLDEKKDAILTIGCTVIKNCRVQLRHNSHQLIKINKEIPEKSIVIHKITHDRVNQGAHLHKVMESLLQKIAGRVLLVHFARIERGFLNAACEQIYGHKIPVYFIDTFEIERRRLQNIQPEVAPNLLRLFNIRERYGLPRYHAHSALEDAIATAELFLAQVAHGSNLNAPLKQFLV